MLPLWLAALGSITLVRQWSDTCTFQIPDVPELGLEPADTGARTVFDPDSYEGTDAAKILSAVTAALAVDGAVVMHRFYELGANGGTGLLALNMGAGGLMVTGGGLRRMCSPQEPLTQALEASDSCLHVADTSEYSVGQWVGVFETNAEGGMAIAFQIESKTATTICDGAALNETAAQGSIVAYYDSALLAVSPSSSDGLVIDSVAFDGGADCNTQTHDWTILNTMSVRGANTIRNSYFYNTPSENIVSCGATVESNYAWDLQGSFLHKSCGSVLPEYINSNRVYNANIATDVLSGHSEGLITFSANAGSMYLRGNIFRKGAEGVFGTAAADETEVHSVYDCYNNFPRLINFSGSFSTATYSFDAVLERVPRWRNKGVSQ